MSVAPLSRKPRQTAYDVVIVGGAAMGSAAAWFLAANPDFSGSVLVVERDHNYTQSSTALSASCIRHQYSNPVNVKASMFGSEFIWSFRDTMDNDPEVPEIELRELGYLFLSGADTAHILRENHQVQAACGAKTVLMSPDEVAAKFPFYNLEGIDLASFNGTGEGWFDGYTMMQWLRRKAREAGVEFLDNEVVAMARDGNTVTSVTLASGEEISCGTVVNCSGPRASRTARMAGLEVPVEPRKRCLFIFDCADDLGQPMPLTIDTSGVHCRSDGQYYLTGGVPEDDCAVDNNDFDVVYDEFDEQIWPALAYRVPAFERIKMVRGWAGHYAYNTLDQNAIVGRHPEVSNFIFCNGFSGHGFQQSPAMGRGVSELITYNGFRSLDMRELGYERVVSGTPFLEKAII